MAIRNKIEEKHMQTEEEANKLLKVTNLIQDLIADVTKREDTYINLSDDVNKNIIKIVNKYLRLLQNSHDIIEQICNKVTTECNLKIEKQNSEVEKELLNAASWNDLKAFASSQTLDTHIRTNTLQQASEKLDYRKYEEFICLQAFLLVCFRFAMKKAKNVHSQEQFDYNTVLSVIAGQKDYAKTLLPTQNIMQNFELDNCDFQQVTCDKLKLQLTQNSDYIRKIQKTIIYTKKNIR